MKTTLMAAAALLCFACGGSVDLGGQGTGGRAGSSATGGSASALGGASGIGTGGSVIGAPGGASWGTGGSTPNPGTGGGTPTPGTGGGPSPEAGVSTSCVSDSDCGLGERCGYAVSNGCSARGSCFPLGPKCNGFIAGCGCDGTTVNLTCTGLPSGYALEPVAHTGYCVDGGSDGGTPTTFPCSYDTAGSCSVSTQYCFYSEAPGMFQDAGAIQGCNTLFADCRANPTCDCIKKYFGSQCLCSQTGGGLTVGCYLGP